VGEKPKMKHVWRVTRSPMNPLRWCLTLDCNHEEWITAKSRPVRQFMRCSKCSSQRKEVDHA